MPNVHVAVPETQQNIFRPIITQIVKQVQEITKLPDTRIYFPDEDKKVQTNGGTIDERDSARYISTTSKRMNQIEVDEEVDPGEISPTFFNGKEYPALFEDRRLGVKLSPIYAKHNVTILFNYKCESKTEALRWLADMRMKLARLRDGNTHTVDYHYSFDSRLYEIIRVIHTLRENQSGYDQSFDDYIKQMSTSRLTIVGGVNGNTQAFSIAERQTEIYGVFDFEGLPSKPEKDEVGNWVIAFGYKFDYDKVIGSHLKYPILVHNQPLPLEYVSFTSDEVREIAKNPVQLSLSQKAFRVFRSDVVLDSIKSEDGVIIIPKFDDFQPTNHTSYTAGLIQIQTTLEPDNLRQLVCLNQLGDVVLDPDIAEFLMQSEYNYIGRLYKSIFQLELFENRIPQSSPILSIDSNLNVSSTINLDIRKQYHLRFSVVMDTDYLPKEAITRLLSYPKVIYKIVCAINRGFRENPELNKLSELKQLTYNEFTCIYNGFLSPHGKYDLTKIGWNSNNILGKLGIDRRILENLIYNSVRPLKTLILGTLAYETSGLNASLKNDAGYLNIPSEA